MTKITFVNSKTIGAVLLALALFSSSSFATFTILQAAIKAGHRLEALARFFPLRPGDDRPWSEHQAFASEVIGATIIAIRNQRFDVIAHMARMDINPFYLDDVDRRTVVHLVARRGMENMLATISDYANRLGLGLPLDFRSNEGNTPAMELLAIGRPDLLPLVYRGLGTYSIDEAGEGEDEAADEPTTDDSKRQCNCTSFNADL